MTIQIGQQVVGVIIDVGYGQVFMMVYVMVYVLVMFLGRMVMILQITKVFLVQADIDKGKIAMMGRVTVDVKVHDMMFLKIYIQR